MSGIHSVILQCKSFSTVGEEQRRFTSACLHALVHMRKKGRACDCSEAHRCIGQWQICDHHARLDAQLQLVAIIQPPQPPSPPVAGAYDSSVQRRSVQASQIHDLCTRNSEYASARHTLGRTRKKGPKSKSMVRYPHC